VKPYVKRQKNDAADAEAICEAVTVQKQQASWRTKWDSNSRFGQRNFAFENSTEFRASIAKLGP
jgi:hypothetical protein